MTAYPEGMAPRGTSPSAESDQTAPRGTSPRAEGAIAGDVTRQGVTRQEGFDHEKYLVNVRVPFSPATSPDEQVLEAMIQDAGLKAPRLTPSDIDAKIKDVQYYLFPGTTLMVCAMTLTNGFVVTGESASASPENFNLTIGRKIAFEKARDKIWSLEGYLLKQKLYQEIKTV